MVSGIGAGGGVVTRIGAPGATGVTATSVSAKPLRDMRCFVGRDSEPAGTIGAVVVLVALSATTGGVAGAAVETEPSAAIGRVPLVALAVTPESVAEVPLAEVPETALCEDREEEGGCTAEMPAGGMVEAVPTPVAGMVAGPVEIEPSAAMAGVPLPGRTTSGAAEPLRDIR